MLLGAPSNVEYSGERQVICALFVDRLREIYDGAFARSYLSKDHHTHHIILDYGNISVVSDIRPLDIALSTPVYCVSPRCVMGELFYKHPMMILFVTDIYMRIMVGSIMIHLCTTFGI